MSLMTTMTSVTSVTILWLNVMWWMERALGLNGRVLLEPGDLRLVKGRQELLTMPNDEKRKEGKQSIVSR